MSQYYDLNNTGPQVQDRLDQTQENKQDIATLEEKVTAIENEIGESGQGGNTINARLDALETAVGSGGSVDERIAAAETEIIGGASSDYNTLGKVEGELEDTYRKNETYSKTELDNLITTPNVLYVTVIATSGTTDVTTLLPATGAADTVYRVGNWDGTQYDPTMYALFAWNGTTYVCLAVRSFVGEVYDVSVNHPDGQGNPTPYADLTTALGTSGANIPADIRRGGMSIKFIQGNVQSSDNKYVQYRLMNNTWSINIADWSICSDTILIENPEFVYVKTDAQNKILWAIKTDGTIYYGAGVPPQIVEYINNKIAELSLDEYEDIITFLGDLLEDDKNLQQLLDEKLDAEGLDANALSLQSSIQNSEYLQVTTDSEDKILEGIKTDGTKVIESPLEIQGICQEVIDNPEFVQTFTDSKGGIVEGLTKKGKKKVMVESEFKQDVLFSGNTFFEKVPYVPNSKSVQIPSYYADGGYGNSWSPYISNDGTAGFKTALSKLTRGGMVLVPSADFLIQNPILIDSRCTRIFGVSWAYQEGVLAIHESFHGSKIKMAANNFAAIKLIGSYESSGSHGSEISNIGIYGNSNDVTVGYFDKNTPTQNVAILFAGVSDQTIIQRVAMSNVAIGISIVDGSFDAGFIKNVNFDGCCVGIYKSNDSGFIVSSQIQDNIFADMSAYCLYVNNMHRSAIRGNNFWKASGLFTQEQINACTDVDSEGNKVIAGVFVNSEYTNISENTLFKVGICNGRIIDQEGEVATEICHGLYLKGNYNRISDNSIRLSPNYQLFVDGGKNDVLGNTIEGDKGIKVVGLRNFVSNNRIDILSGGDDYSISVNGNNNTIANNVCNKTIKIQGNNNIVVGNVFFDSNIEVEIVSGNNNVIIGVSQDKVIDNGTGTIIK